MDQKTQFIADYLRQQLSMTELCELYGISRKSGYKLIDRYLQYGPQGLEERSRKPGSHPNETPAQVVQAIVEARQRHPSWGAKKRLRILTKRHARWSFPARSTVCDILSRHGLVPKRRIGVTSAIRANPAARSWRPTTSGARTSRGSSKPAMESTAMR
jgi:transposase